MPVYSISSITLGRTEAISGNKTMQNPLRTALLESDLQCLPKIKTLVLPDVFHNSNYLKCQHVLTQVWNSQIHTDCKFHNTRTLCYILFYFSPKSTSKGNEACMV